MTRDVLVRISGLQLIDGEHDDVEVITSGDYFWKNGKHYILYDEVIDGEYPKHDQDLGKSHGSKEDRCSDGGSLVRRGGEKHDELCDSDGRDARSADDNQD